MNTNSTTDLLQHHLERLQAGEEAARNDLLGHAAGRLRRLTREMLNDFERLRRWLETDDVFHEAILHLCRRLQATIPASLLHFFRLAAQEIRCQLIDLSRHYYGPRGMGNFLAEPDGAHEEESSPSPDPSTSTWEPEGLAVWSEFHRCVEALPEEEREVFDLLWYQGLTNTDAARLLNVTTKTILKRWRAACFKLDEALGGQLPGM